MSRSNHKRVQEQECREYVIVALIHVHVVKSDHIIGPVVTVRISGLFLGWQEELPQQTEYNNLYDLSQSTLL